MKISKKILPLLLLLGMLSTGVATNDEGIVLTVHVKGARPGVGQVILSVFTSPRNFLKEAVLSLTEPVGSQGTVIFTMPAMEPGTYAISAIYDEDKDGKLKTGFMGIPKEMVGFSNAAKGRFGPPSFEKVAFQLRESRKIDIYLGKVED